MPDQQGECQTRMPDGENARRENARRSGILEEVIMKRMPDRLAFSLGLAFSPSGILVWHSGAFSLWNPLAPAFTPEKKTDGLNDPPPPVKYKHGR